MPAPASSKTAPKPSLELSASEAKALTLRTLGVDGKPDRTVMDVVNRLGLLQIDSVNVFERAHYMPLFSRLGAYDKSELENLMGGFHPTLIEYWAHEASIIPLDRWPLYRWRMNAYRERYENKWGMKSANSKLVRQITDQLRANGPMSTNQFETEAHQRKGSWWGWSDLKSALEYAEQGAALAAFVNAATAAGGRAALLVTKPVRTPRRRSSANASGAPGTATGPR